MSGTTTRDAQAITYLARRLREETPGARAWDDAGTYAKVSELVGQNLELTLERVFRHAADPEAKTPGAIHRPFVPPAASTKEPRRAHPARREDQCRRCGGELPTCACTLEARAVEYDDEPPTGSLSKDEALAQMRATLAACRNAIHEAREA